MKKSTLRFWSLILIGVSVWMANPAVGLTVNEENEISDEFMKYIYQQYEMVDDEEVVNYIQTLGEKILKHYPPQPFKYRFYIIKDDTYNAFAGPSAQIFIHTGLIETLTTEDQLAGIIGHEISHATCRHIAKNIDRSGKIGLGTLAGVAAGIFLSIYGDPTAGSALTIGSIAGSQSVSLAYSRDDELQADQQGLQHLVEAGYNPRGLIEALSIIRSKQWYGKEQIPTYLSTHPALEDRIAFIENWLDTHADQIKTVQHNDGFEFTMIHTKIKALYGDINSAEKYFKDMLKSDPDNLFGLYGTGMVLARKGKLEDSVVYLKKALEKKAFHVGMLKTLGEVYFNMGHYDNSLNVFKGALSLVPRDFESNFFVARILTEKGDYDQALTYIMPFASEDKGMAGAFYVLGEIYAKKSMMPESYYNLGLYYLQKKDAKSALNQFERALKQAGQKEMKEKIQAKIDQIKGNDKKGKKEAEEKTSKSFLASGGPSGGPDFKNLDK